LARPARAAAGFDVAGFLLAGFAAFATAFASAITDFVSGDVSRVAAFANLASLSARLPSAASRATGTPAIREA
jgi:hypothetical protein